MNQTKTSIAIPTRVSSLLLIIKEDEIPLLIIDVNIRPGVKKKINVYDGDTAESLASKFAQEHSNIFNFYSNNY